MSTNGAHRVKRRTRAFFLADQALALALIAVLTLATFVTFNSVLKRAPSSADNSRLTASVAAGRTLVVTAGSVVPADIVARLPKNGLPFVEGPSTKTSEISVARLSSYRVAYAVTARGGCVAVMDDLESGVVTWFKDAAVGDGRCDASRLGLTDPVQGTTFAEPAVFDFDAAGNVPSALAAPQVDVTATGASVSFARPTREGGSPVNTYSVECASSSSGQTVVATGQGSPIAVNLVLGETYSCTVSAANGFGYSDPSAPSDEFVP